MQDQISKEIPDACQAHLEKKQRIGTVTEEERNHLEFIKRNMSNEHWFAVLKYDINYLTSLIVACIKQNWLGGIVVFSDGII